MRDGKPFHCLAPIAYHSSQTRPKERYVPSQLISPIFLDLFLIIYIHESPANIATLADLFKITPVDLARRVKLPSSDVQLILSSACRDVAPSPVRLSELAITPESTTFTTGDPALDDMLHGGFRTGTVWDLAGES